MELFVVLPPCATDSAPRTVAMAVQDPAVTTIGALKQAIQARSARAYHRHRQGEEEEEVQEEEEDMLLLSSGIPAAMQRLTLGGRHLRDEQTLEECAVTGYVGRAWVWMHWMDWVDALDGCCARAHAQCMYNMECLSLLWGTASSFHGAPRLFTDLLE